MVKEQKPFPGCLVKVLKKPHAMNGKIGGVVRVTDKGNFVVKFADGERVFSEEELTTNTETSPRLRREKEEDTPNIVRDFMGKKIMVGDVLIYAKSNGFDIGRVMKLIYFNGKEGVQAKTLTSCVKWANQSAMMVVSEDAIPREMIPCLRDEAAIT